jgi:hypothetical protein
MLRRVVRSGPLTGALERCDDWLLRRLPGLGRFCRYAVLTLHRVRYNEMVPDRQL